MHVMQIPTIVCPTLATRDRNFAAQSATLRKLILTTPPSMDNARRRLLRAVPVVGVIFVVGEMPPALKMAMQ